MEFTKQNIDNFLVNHSLHRKYIDTFNEMIHSIAFNFNTDFHLDE